MIEYHGWAVIRESYKEEDENEDLLNAIIREIQLKIDVLNKTLNEKYILELLNGSYHLNIMAEHNHRSDHIVEFYQWISKTAIGSYGTLYINDDEDVNNSNQFKVWVMKKGAVVELNDSFLSPVNPEIEN